MKTYESFLRIPSAHLCDEPPCADPAYLVTRGIQSCAPDVLRAMRRIVLPTIAKMNPRWYCLLIHDRASGVPTKEGDTNIYIHLRATFVSSKKVRFPPEWEMTRRADLATEIAGVDQSVLPSPLAWEIIGEQSAWFVNFLRAHAGAVDDLAVLKHARQFLHFFANMAQMRVE